MAQHFFVHLCTDTQIEVLRWGKRTELARLENESREVHWLVDRYFKNGPLIPFSLECQYKEEARNFRRIFATSDAELKLVHVPNMVIFFQILI